MKPSRRSRLPSNGPSKRSKPTPLSPTKQRSHPESTPAHLPVPEPQTPPTQSTTALTAAARYEKNLNCLRRVDPTIVSIIDQFSHICLYRLHEGKWQKDGHEGASFLFERCVLRLCRHPCHPELTSNIICLDLPIPPTASLFSIAPGCTITHTPSFQKTKYSRRENILCIALIPNLPPSASPWPNRLHQR